MARAVNVALLVVVCVIVMLATWCIHRAHHISPLAIAFVVTLWLWLLSCIAAICSDNYTAHLIQDGLMALSFILFIPTVFGWPGGDDGSGMGLVWLVGPCILFGMVLEVFSNHLNSKR